MNNVTFQLLLLAGLGLLTNRVVAQPATDMGPYKIVNSAKLMGTGGIDYVSADSAGRRLYVPRGNQVLVFDLDTLKPVGSITNTRAHGVAIDTQSHHAFASSSPVAMWDSQTLALIKTIPVEGGPDGIYCDQASQRIFVLSHRAPNITVLDAKDGSIVGTVDLGGAPEQSQSDSQGHLYVDLEDKESIAVVDLSTLKVTNTYSLGGKGGPSGLGLDAKNHILFAMCREPATCVILDANTGKILDTLPTGTGTDGGGFNPATMEAFSSQRDGTLTIIKETSPTNFIVEQNVKTMTGAKTCTLDTQKDQIIVAAVLHSGIPTPPLAAPTTPAGNNPAAANPAARASRQRANNGPGELNILVVGSWHPF